MEVNTIRKVALELLLAHGHAAHTSRPMLEKFAVQDSDYLIRRSALEHLMERFGSDHSVLALISQRVTADPDEAVRRAASRLCEARQVRSSGSGC